MYENPSAPRDGVGARIRSLGSALLRIKTPQSVSKIETALLTDRRPNILSFEDFSRARVEAGFLQGRRGTYRNLDNSQFLYTKRCHEVTSEEQAHRALLLLRSMTSKGVLYPETEWGVYRGDELFQLFAITPALVDYSDNERNPDPVRQPLKYIPPDCKGMWDEDSQVVDMYRRLEPSFNPSQPPPANSILRLLDPMEARHLDNWGWDENGRVYPVDVEVITLDRANVQEIIHDWYIQQFP
jgi:hypothetical protein